MGAETERMASLERRGRVLRDWAADQGMSLAEVEALARSLLLSAKPTPALDALRLAEAFMCGFEDDPLQEGMAARLAAVRAAIKAEETLIALGDSGDPVSLTNHLERIIRNGMSGVDAPWEMAESTAAQVIRVFFSIFQAKEGSPFVAPSMGAK